MSAIVISMAVHQYNRQAVLPNHPLLPCDKAADLR